MSHYETLGIKPDATPDEVKRAYRKKASENHPDRNDGDHSKMQMINKARDVLIDPRRRAEYDETGNVEGETPIEHRAAHTLAEFFAAALGADAPNLIIAVREMLKMQADECRRTARGAAGKRAKYLARREKIKTKAGHQNIVHGLIDAAVVDLDAVIVKAEETLEVNALAGKMADAYESTEEVDFIMPMRGAFFDMGFTR